MSKDLSKYLSLILRHDPSAAGITVDSAGWTDTSILLDKLSIDMQSLEFVVQNNNKKRFSFSDDKKKIRANQGHSISVPDLDLKEISPPDVLYHGTAKKNEESILSSGLDKRGRNHVHQSKDIDTAINVGSRHGKPIVFKVDAAKMHDDGFAFYLSDNNVWLTDNVPAKYLSIL
jgi:putative RNA 2'-phosphotransferase